MNIALARNEYTNAKSNALNSKSENFDAVSLALRHLLESMTALKDAQSPDEREPLFEKSLTSIYFLQKCLDFEAGGDLAKICSGFTSFPDRPCLTLFLEKKVTTIWTNL